MTHEEEVQFVFNRACEVLKRAGFSFRPMLGRKQGVKSFKRAYTLGHTNFKTKAVTVDIYTARCRQPKKISAILAIIAHELAHHQKPPYRQRFCGRWIIRQHYPGYYRQVNKNIKKFKEDQILGEYYQ